MDKDNKPFFSDSELLLNFKKIYHKIDAYMKSIKKDMVPSIVGGEPTYWSYEFQKEILETIKTCKKYLLFTNGFDVSSPLFKDSRAIPYIHVLDYSDLNSVSCILDKVQETNKKEWYICTVVVHNSLYFIKKYLEFMRERDLEKHIYLQPCDHSEARFYLSQEELKELSNFCEENNFVGMGEKTSSKSVHLLTPSVYLNCWQNRSLYVDIVKNIISSCDHWTYPTSLDDIYDIGKYLENQKLPCIDKRCTSPIHCDL